MATASYPEFRSLTEAECVGLLERNHVGRLAFTFRDYVDVQPLHYVYDDGWLYGRTSEGAKLETLAHHQWIAFEVDEIAGPFDWESVVVRGSFFRLDDADTRDPAIAAHATALLRSVAPETLSRGDPAPHRDVLFRISIRELSGRASRLTAGRQA